jgi:hypothetical protein
MAMVKIPMVCLSASHQGQDGAGTGSKRRLLPNYRQKFYPPSTDRTKLFGGLARSRTGLEGFAVLCVAVPPRGPSGVSSQRGCQQSEQKSLRSSCEAPPLRLAPACFAIDRQHFAKHGRPCYIRPRQPKQSLIAQLVEQSTVNRSVAGSSPAQGANSIQSWRELRALSPAWPTKTAPFARRQAP